MEVANGYEYIGFDRILLVIEFLDGTFSIKNTLAFNDKIENIRVDGDFLYINLKSGQMPIIFTEDPTQLYQVGEHAINNWVAGAGGDYYRIYRSLKNPVEIVEKLQ